MRRSATLQFVRKLSGFTAPSKANEAAFQRAVEEVFQVSRRLIDSLVTGTPARDRAVEAAKAKARNAERFGRPAAPDPGAPAAAAAAGKRRGGHAAPARAAGGRAVSRR